MERVSLECRTFATVRSSILTTLVLTCGQFLKLTKDLSPWCFFKK